MTGFEPSPILTFSSVVHCPTTAPVIAAVRTTAKLCNLCEEHVNVIKTVPDPNPRVGGQLPDSNECNSTLTSETMES